MLIISSHIELKNKIDFYRAKNLTIGFVPTMGALHQGHLSLISKAKTINDIVVCSIYVNPLQFNNKEDFEKYPRLAEQDCTMLEKAKCNIVYIPNNLIIADSADFEYEIGTLDEIMEGLFRPGHFKGVAFIVKKLFEIVNPHNAYFGEKDYQQLALIKKLTKDFLLNVDVISCPTIREHDGLALSSRNARLSKAQRSIAAKIYEGLNLIKNNINNFSFDELKSMFVKHIEATNVMKVEYIEICDAENLQLLSNISQSKSIIICTAVYLEKIRLIDNIKINL